METGQEEERAEQDTEEFDSQAVIDGLRYARGLQSLPDNTWIEKEEETDP